MNKLDTNVAEAIDRHERWLYSDGREGKRFILRNFDIGSLRGCDLTHRYLNKADLSIGDLSGCDFTRAHFNSTDLSAANLTDANLSETECIEADFSRATLVNVDLTSANLGKSHFYLSTFYNVTLDGVSMSSTNLMKARGIVRFSTSIDGYDFIGVLNKNDVVWIKAGCRWFTAADARDHWTTRRVGTVLGEERLAIVDFLEQSLLRQAKYTGGGAT